MILNISDVNFCLVFFQDVVDRMAICSHLMYIVAMEMYYVLKNEMDKELMYVLKKFAKEDCYSRWTKVSSRSRSGGNFIIHNFDFLAFTLQ